VVSLAVVGNVNVDLLTWPVSIVPPPGTERPIERIDLRVGGAAAVTGATLARLGADPIVVGCVGRDPFGRIALDELERYGVDTTHVRELEGQATAVSIAFEAPGTDRSFLIALGSLAAFEPSMIPDEALGARHVLLCGYFNLPAIRGRAARDVLNEVRSRGGMSLLDTGWDHDEWQNRTRDEIMSVLPLVDVFVPNEVEVERIAGVADPVAAASVLARRSGRWTVVKLGATGAVAVSADGRSRRVMAPRVDVVDTTGAGDAFNAGLMRALADGADPAEALDVAVAVASTVVSRRSDDRYPPPEDVLPAGALP
jgi:sugar/nucleoside kinase (ribokinase family)